MLISLGFVVVSTKCHYKADTRPGSFTMSFSFPGRKVDEKAFVGIRTLLSKYYCDCNIVKTTLCHCFVISLMGTLARQTLSDKVV